MLPFALCLWIVRDAVTFRGTCGKENWTGEGLLEEEGVTVVVVVEVGWLGWFHRWGTMEAHGVMRVVVLILGALDPRQRSVRGESMVRFGAFFSSSISFFPRG
jgi:hypothetical protein